MASDRSPRQRARTLRIHVKPGARTESLVEQTDGTWLAKIAAPPIDGKANAALVALVAATLGVPKARVSIRSGAAGRWKTVDVVED